MTILETSPNGKLRLRVLRNGKGVVELFAHGEWFWCVWRSRPIDEAKSLFASQVQHHQD